MTVPTQLAQGRVEVCSVEPLGGIRAVLSHFAPDGDRLLNDHVLFLSARVIPLLDERPAHVWLHASVRPGSSPHLVALASRRASALAEHLRQRGISSAQIHLDHVDYGLAPTRLTDSAQTGMISLVVAEVFAPAAYAAWPSATPLPVATSFEIQTVATLSKGDGPLGVARMGFVIRDLEHQIEAHYDFHAGAEVVAPPEGDTSANDTRDIRGPWMAFATSEPLALTAFAGNVRLTCSSDVWRASNWLFPLCLPTGVRTDPSPLAIPTGFSMGSAAITMYGSLALVSLRSTATP